MSEVLRLVGDVLMCAVLLGLAICGGVMLNEMMRGEDRWDVPEREPSWREQSSCVRVIEPAEFYDVEARGWL